MDAAAFWFLLCLGHISATRRAGAGAECDVGHESGAAEQASCDGWRRLGTDVCFRYRELVQQSLEPGHSRLRCTCGPHTETGPSRECCCLPAQPSCVLPQLALRARGVNQTWRPLEKRKRFCCTIPGSLRWIHPGGPCICSEGRTGGLRLLCHCCPNLQAV